MVIVTGSGITVTVADPEPDPAVAVMAAVPGRTPVTPHPPPTMLVVTMDASDELQPPRVGVGLPPEIWTLS
jgi:hypothetical protein